jgi:hypothetical protein
MTPLAVAPSEDAPAAKGGLEYSTYSIGQAIAGKVYAGIATITISQP